MPGPVSDRYDPEFGTGDNAEMVRLAVESIVRRVGDKLGPELRNIVGVVYGEPGRRWRLEFSEQELRVIRFACNRALESL